MNPLNINPFGNNFKQTSNINLNSNILQVKQLMKMSQNNPAALLQQNPMIGQIMQMYRGQNLQSVYMNMCKQKGVDPNVILNELRS
jgi:hypothetical protein